MLKPMLKLIRNRGRGSKAPAVLDRPNLFTRLVRSTRGYAFLGASVSMAAVVVVSLLTWLSGFVDNAIGRPTEVIERVLPGVLEQVDDQLATLIGTDEGTVQGAVLRSAREGLAAVGSTIPRPGTPREAITNTNRFTSVTSNPPASSGPTTFPEEPSAATSTPGSASPTTNESSPKTTGETTSQRPSETPSSPASASEEPPPATQEEPPSQEPPAQEPPPQEETPTPEVTPPPVTKELPPTVESPSGEAPPPVTEVPLPVTKTPPPVASELPPVADQPPPTPNGV